MVTKTLEGLENKAGELFGTVIDSLPEEGVFAEYAGGLVLFVGICAALGIATAKQMAGDVADLFGG